MPTPFIINNLQNNALFTDSDSKITKTKDEMRSKYVKFLTLCPLAEESICTSSFATLDPIPSLFPTHLHHIEHHTE